MIDIHLLRHNIIELRKRIKRIDKEIKKIYADKSHSRLQKLLFKSKKTSYTHTRITILKARINENRKRYRELIQLKCVITKQENNMHRKLLNRLSLEGSKGTRRPLK